MAKRILVVEDNKDMRRAVADFLMSHGYDVVEAPSTEEGIDIVDEQKLDFGLIDINLPGKSGYDMIEYIREQGLEIPLLALTARDGIEDKLKGFELGLTDYMIKPFDLREVLARIQTHLKDSEPNENEPIETKNFRINPSNLEFSKQGKAVDLTQLEFRIMHLLMRRQNLLVKLDELITYAWGEDDELVNPPIRIHIANIRKKIGDDDFSIIRTVAGTGYIFKDEESS